MDRIALDTTLLIDLQNERRGRGAPRGAAEFVRLHRNVELLLPVVARGEYLEGFDDPDSREARELVDGLRVLNVTCTVARWYAVVARELRRTGALVGSNDLWIGCTAKAAGIPLVTRNVDEFRRIPDLEVIGYAPPDARRDD